MPRNLSQYNISTLAKFLIVTFVVFVISILPVRDYVTSLVGFVSEPVSYWTSGITTSINTSLMSIDGIFTLREEYNNLKIKSAQLEAENNTVKLLESENDALKEQLKLGKSDVKHVQAQVVSNGILGQGEYLIVNKGTRDGVKVGQRVVLGNIFIGLISEATERSSKVSLPVSKNLNLRVRIVAGDVSEVKMDELQGDSRNQNYAYGVSTGNISGIQVENIVLNFEIKSGQTVIVDDEKVGLFMVLGKVNRVEQKDSDPTKTAVIDPMANYYELKYVFIDL